MTWYLLRDGLDTQGCGTHRVTACLSLQYLLDQYIGTQILAAKTTNLQIMMDHSLQISQQIIVSFSKSIAEWTTHTHTHTHTQCTHTFRHTRILTHLHTHTHIFTIVTGRNEVVAKVIFLHVSVIHSVQGGGSVCLSECWDTTHTPTPWEQTPPKQTPPLGADTPREQTPPEQTSPQSRHPPGKHPPAYGQ